MSETPKARVFDADGSPQGDLPLPPGTFGVEPNLPLIHQVVTAQLAGARRGSASTLTRAEARGGGRKPWRQKGLGRARHGSRRAPQWVGGGVAHGPKPRSYAQRTPRKMKRLALRGALSARASEGRIIVIDLAGWSEPKTRRARSLLEAVDARGKSLVVLAPSEETVALSFRNLAEVELVFPSHLTPYQVLWADQVLFTSDALSWISASDTYEVTKDDFVREEETS